MAGTVAVWGYLRSLPPDIATKFVTLLNAGPQERYDGLKLTSDGFNTSEELEAPRAHVLEDLEGFIKLGSGPWTLVSWESPERNSQSFLVRDARGRQTGIRVVTLDGGEEIAAVWFWPYVKGKTLAEIAESALDVTRSTGLTLAYWRNGKESIESRGNRLPVSNDPLQPGDRWPANLHRMLLHLAVARVVEAGELGWDDRVQTWLPQYRLPEQTQDMTVRQLLQGTHKQGFVDPRPYPRTGPPPENESELEPFLKESFSSNYETIPSETDLLVLLAVVQSATGMRADAVVQRHVLDPLELASSRFGAPGAGQYESMWPEAGARDLLAMAEGKRFSASVGDLLKLGRLKLDAESGTSTFLEPETFANLRSLQPVMAPDELFTWGWRRMPTPKGTYWLAYPGNCVMLGVFPTQNAVIAVALDDPPQDTLSLAGPIFWRIAEQLCGWLRE